MESTLGALLLCACVLSGCGEDDDAGPTGSGDPKDDGHPPAEMLGSWTFQSVTEDGASADLAVVMEWEASAVEAHINILENGAYVYEEVDTRGGQLWFESGFVFVAGGEIDVNVQQAHVPPIHDECECSVVRVRLHQEQREPGV